MDGVANKPGVETTQGRTRSIHHGDPAGGGQIGSRYGVRWSADRICEGRQSGRVQVDVGIGSIYVHEMPVPRYRPTEIGPLMRSLTDLFLSTSFTDIPYDRLTC
uniref:Uncharacterized protein n=1 Tax=Vespula pensylvanica TaxID=30213 RepID=A0A834K1K8_VESPE|nr:hypothetical protein H0235_016451 [Vespula pensylvanica]